MRRFLRSLLAKYLGSPPEPSHHGEPEPEPEPQNDSDYAIITDILQRLSNIEESMKTMARGVEATRRKIYRESEKAGDDGPEPEPVVVDPFKDLKPGDPPPPGYLL